MDKVLKKIIKFYQNFISPLMPARCRYHPTCSEYGLTALEWHGATKGSLLLIKRVCSCHPLGGHGIDFVPLPLYQYQFLYSPIKYIPDYIYKDKFYYLAHLNKRLK